MGVEGVPSFHSLIYYFLISDDHIVRYHLFKQHIVFYFHLLNSRASSQLLVYVMIIWTQSLTQILLLFYICSSLSTGEARWKLCTASL